jgi:hypothetical protein
MSLSPLFSGPRVVPLRGLADCRNIGNARSIIPPKSVLMVDFKD